jgi:hypothetical protein
MYPFLVGISLLLPIKDKLLLFSHRKGKISFFSVEKPLSKMNINLNSKCNLSPLIEQMKRYKPSKSSHHKGNVFQHSIWTARYVEHTWRNFETTRKPRSTPRTESGTENGLFTNLLRLIPPEYMNFTLLAAFLHDIGKLDGEFSVEEHPEHPLFGGLLFENCPGVELVLTSCMGSLKRFLGSEAQKFLAGISLFHLYLGNAMQKKISPAEFAKEFVATCVSLKEEKIKILMAILLLISLADVKGARPVGTVKNSGWKLLTIEIDMEEDLPESETPWFRYGYTNFSRVRKIMKEVMEEVDSQTRVLELLRDKVELKPIRTILKF